MRIVFICRSLGIGGAEGQLSLLATALASRGHDVTVIALYDDGPCVRKRLTAAQFQLVTLAKKDRYHLLGPLISLWRELASRQPDIVHGYLPVPNLVSLIAYGLRPRPRVIWGVRASDMRMASYDWLARGTYWLEGILSRFADKVIVNSSAGIAVARARGFSEEKLVLIRNGVDTSRFRPDVDAGRRVRSVFVIEGSKYIVGHVARIDPMKDHDSFLDAIGLVAQGRTDVRAVCVAVGDESALEDLRGRVARRRLEDIVTVAVGTRGIEEILPAFDVLCVSSRFGEGTPNVVLEAMACGVPCIVTAVGDAPDVVGASGQIARPEDPGDIATRILTLITRLGVEGAELREASRARALDYSVEKLVDTSEQLFDAIRGGR